MHTYFKQIMKPRIMKIKKLSVINLFIGFLLSLFFISCEKSDSTDDTDTSEQTIPEPFVVIGPMDPISNIPYSEIPNREYIIELDRWDIPNNRTEPIKTTDNINAAITWAVEEGYGIIRLPAGEYLIGKYGNGAYQAGIELASNMAFLLDKDAIIEMDSNDKWNSCAITITNQQNVLISGGTVKGDRETHIYVPRPSDGSDAHDEGHCICVQTRSENITIENMVLKDGTGDGIFLIAQDTNLDSQVKNINIFHNNIDNNRRQGISVVGARDVLIEDNEIHHTNGTSPQHGIDIESYPYKTNNVTIRSNYLHDNVGQILNFDGIDTIIENNYIEQGDDLDRHIDAPIISRNKSNVIFRNNFLSLRTESRSSNWNGVTFYAFENISPENINTKLHEYSNNTFINCGIFLQNHQNALIKDNDFDFGHIAMKNMNDVQILDNNITHDNICWPFRFQNVKGIASGNTYNGNPAIGLELNEDIAFTGACQ